MPPKTPPPGSFLWTMDQEEKLLFLVQRFPCLFDIRLTDYKNINVRSNAFAEISKSIGCSVLEANTKWTKLKEKYIRERNKLKNKPSGSESGDAHSSWPLYDSMHQFSAHFQSRPRHTNITSKSPLGEHNSNTMVDKSTGNAPPVEEFNKSPGEGRVRVASDQSSSEERDENTPPPTSQVTITHRGSDFILEGDDFESLAAVRDHLDLLVNLPEGSDQLQQDLASLSGLESPAPVFEPSSHETPNVTPATTPNASNTTPIPTRLADKRRRRSSPTDERDLMKNLGALIEKVVSTDEVPVAVKKQAADSCWTDYGSSLGKTLAGLPNLVAMKIRHRIESVIYEKTVFGN